MGTVQYKMVLLQPLRRKVIYADDPLPATSASDVNTV